MEDNVSRLSVMQHTMKSAGRKEGREALLEGLWGYSRSFEGRGAQLAISPISKIPRFGFGFEDSLMD